MIKKSHAIHSLVADSTVSIDAEGNVTWIVPSIAPVTDEQINAEFARLQAEYDAKQYQRDRVAEYPSIQEQMDMQYWDAINGTTTWQDAINAVKTKYPKGA
jgi:hypothetical protein